jgi:hypothetical protein
VYLFFDFNFTKANLIALALSVLVASIQASEPVKESEYVLVKNLEKETQDKLTHCIAGLTQKKIALAQQLQTPLNPLFTNLKEEEPTLKEKVRHVIEILVVLQDYVNLLFARTTPLLYEMFDSTYKNDLEGVSLSPYQVYPHLGFSNKKYHQYNA